MRGTFPAGLAPRRIAVFRALGLGDMLCAVPAVRAMRARWPRARIALIGLPWAAELVGRFPRYLDEFLAFPGYPGIVEGGPPRGLAAFTAAVQRRRLDLAVQMHGSGAVSNRFVTGLGAARAAGFHPPGTPAPGPYFHPYPEGLHEVHRWLHLAERLGAPPAGDHLEFPLWAGDVEAARALRRSAGLPSGRYVLVHPGASRPERCWPAARFAAAGRVLAGWGYRVAVTGTAAEAETASLVASRIPGAVSLVGRTALGALAALLRDARLLLCNDTGVSHLAAAVGTPSVVLFVAADPRRWAPLDRTRHRPLGDSAGAAVTVEAVLEEARGLIALAPGGGNAVPAPVPLAAPAPVPLAAGDDRSVGR